MVIENMNKKTKKTRIFHDFLENKENWENKVGPVKKKGEYIRKTRKYVILCWYNITHSIVKM